MTACDWHPLRGIGDESDWYRCQSCTGETRFPQRYQCPNRKKPEAPMTTSDEWAEMRARLLCDELGISAADFSSETGAAIAAALQEAIERGKADAFTKEVAKEASGFVHYHAGRQSILARLENPDEALVEAARRAWMNRDLSDANSEPLRDTIRALALALTAAL